LAKQYTCEEVKTRLQQQINAGKPIIIAGAGTGISGKQKKCDLLSHLPAPN
jgi:predicted TIM-barrel enzyme